MSVCDLIRHIGMDSLNAAFSLSDNLQRFSLILA